MKAGLLAFGALLWAAPVFAQAQDPLAPLPDERTPTAVEPASEHATSAAVRFSADSLRADRFGRRRCQSPRRSHSRLQQLPRQPSHVAVPKDWRGVFDAIDTGNWASAQAGIATLPPSILTPVAKAELYTAKGSPVVDLASLQALIAQAPELPQADQLALMAMQARRDDHAADRSRARDREPRLRARPLQGAGRFRASPPPTSSAPSSIR